MLPTKALQDYENLPKEAKNQIVDFIEFMKLKHQKPPGASPMTSKLRAKNGSFGSIHVTKSVSLEEMDDAIAEGANHS